MNSDMTINQKDSSVIGQGDRIFYLDFIRAIAVVSILITHFNAVFMLWEPPMMNKLVITGTVSNIYIGSWGVSLFIIISGAALMHVYGSSTKKIKLGSFYKKRFLTLYPMFWIAYLLCFCYKYYIYKGFPFSNDIPKSRFLLTIFGFDGYLAANMRQFYQLGEWFLGLIILLYLIFPLLKFLINKYPRVLAIIAVAVYLAVIVFSWKDSQLLGFNKDKWVFMRLPEFLLGMYVIKYKHIVIPRLYKALLASMSLILLILNGIFEPDIDTMLQVTYVGALSFIVLVVLAGFVNVPAVRGVSSFFSKYSYAIFLVHHQMQYTMMYTFDLVNISHASSYLLFISISISILFVAVGLYYLEAVVMKWCKKYLHIREVISE